MKCQCGIIVLCFNNLTLNHLLENLLVKMEARLFITLKHQYIYITFSKSLNVLRMRLLLQALHSASTLQAE